MATIEGGHPRILVIDTTCRQDGTATGAVKEALFAGWPAERYLQIHSAGPDDIAFFGAPSITRRCTGLVADPVAAEMVRAFAPQLVLYRPVPDLPRFHLFAMGILRLLADTPLAIWIMDDWPTALVASKPVFAGAMNHDLRSLLDRASLRLAIGDAMTVAFGQRYGVPFQAFGNGVQLSQWPRPASRPEGAAFTLRYGGSLAANMTLGSLVLLARVVDALNEAGGAYRLEINARQFWWESARQVFAPFAATVLTSIDRTEAEYRQWLSQADAVVIAYNFDPVSRVYCRYSIANKLPELLACGAPLLAIGPEENATIELIAGTGCGAVISSADASKVGGALAAFAQDGEYRANLIEAARRVALEQFDINRTRQAFTAALAAIADPAPPPYDVVTDIHPRSAQAHLDETEVIAVLSDGWPAATDRIMLDVGAHVGSSSQYFIDRGWSSHCFEPDAANREKLERRFAGNERVRIHPVAVGEQASAGAAFFTSGESTGISSLLPFRDSHACVGEVPVTTLDAFTRAHGITRVDFLKIDAEGWDLMVLRGVPWDRLRPAVIECEFEDAKTERLGYRMRDTADYLQARGYSVYVSEWHPIIRYGIRHQWCRIVRYPTPPHDIRGWGNLLAFQTDPGPDALDAAIGRCVKVPDPSAVIRLRGPATQHVRTVSREIDLLALPPGLPVWIYGASAGGEIIHDLLRRQGGPPVAGFLDSHREGRHCGLPVRHYAGAADIDGKGSACIIVASQYSREIIARLNPGVGPVYDAAALILRIVTDRKS
ncbi:FkbM family methyltransferase [Niveispirillum sp. KHB5.9]|uniref:FkbM family methyltransferase n=1 Tax=Niveispirillum sp. KHB5.9 TaxID=3400269 RepID=UPI003A884E57